MDLRLRDFLLSNPLFLDFQEKELDKLAEAFIWRIVPAGEEVFAEGEKGDSLFIIARGVVRIKKKTQRGRWTTLSKLGPHSVFGEMSILDASPRSATAVAEEPAYLVVLTRDAFERMLKKDKPTALNLLVRVSRVLSMRLRHTTAEYSDVIEMLSQYQGNLNLD